MSFKKRLLSYTFTKSGQPFVESGTDTVKLEGLRSSAKIVRAGGASMSTAQVSIYGMTKSQMDQLSTLGMQIKQVPISTMIIEAGDEDGMSKVFEGTISGSWGDYDAQPDVSLRVEAQASLVDAVSTAVPTSYEGGVDVATAMQGFASEMNLTFENHGVDAKLADPYFYGSPRNKALACAQAAGIRWVIEDGVLAIWPQNGAREGDVILVSKETGMVGYPAYTISGVAITMLFNPALKYGRKIQVKSDLTAANGDWGVVTVDDDLESQVPNGSWFSRVEAYGLNFPAQVR